MKENPAASAKPRAWLAIPALPSCNTQMSGGVPLIPATDGKAIHSFTKTVPEQQADGARRNKIAPMRDAAYDPPIEKEGTGCGESGSTVSTAASCGTC